VLRLRSLAFTTGRSRFLDHGREPANRTAKVHVKIAFSGMDEAVFAQLDTGAAWSVLSPDIARKLALPADPENQAIMNTWLGRKVGSLVRVPFTFLADEGEELATEGIFFVSPDWPEGLSFLGYSGLLDSIRIALDPQANDFYFGPG